MTEHTNITIRRLLEAKIDKKCLHCKEALTGMRAYSSRTKYCDDVCRIAFHQEADLTPKGKRIALRRKVSKIGRGLEKVREKAKELSAAELASLRRAKRLTKDD